MSKRFSWKYRAIALAVTLLILSCCVPVLAGSSLSGGGGVQSKKSITRGFSWILKPSAAKAAQGSMETLATPEGRAAYVAGALSDLYQQQLIDPEKLSLSTCRMGWDDDEGMLTAEILLRYDGEPYIILTGHTLKGQCCIVMGYTMDVSAIEDDVRRFYRNNPEEAYLDLLISCYANRAEVEEADIFDQVEKADAQLSAALQTVRDGDVHMTAVNGVYVNELPYAADGVVLTDIEIDQQKVTCAFRNEGDADVKDLKWEYACYNADGVLIGTAAFAVPDLPAGQSGIGSVEVSEDTAGLLFGVGVQVAAQISFDEVSAEPAAEEPVTEEPAAEEPVTEEPAEEEPVTEEPVEEEPATEEPVAEEPAAEEPAEEEPVTEEPVAEDPAAEEPVAEEPAAEEAAEEEPAEEPAETEESEGEEPAERKTAQVNGVTVNAMPFKLYGVVLTGIEIDRQKVTCAFANESGEDISGLTWHFACYNAKGVKVREGSFVIPDIPEGQTAFGRMYLKADTAYLFFMDGNTAPETLEEKPAAEEIPVPADDSTKLHETKRDPKQI